MGRNHATQSFSAIPGIPGITLGVAVRIAHGRVEDHHRSGCGIDRSQGDLRRRIDPDGLGLGNPNITSQIDRFRFQGVRLRHALIESKAINPGYTAKV